MTALLRSERVRKGLRPADLAEAIGVHPMSILRWERRERLPGPAHVHALARVLELEPARVADFFDDARAGSPTPGRAAGHRGHGVRILRWRAGVPAGVIAEAVGVPVSTVYNWEAGRARVPEDHVPALSAVLGLPPTALVEQLRRRTAVIERPGPPPSPLRQLRHRRRMSQARAAATAGIDRHALGAWERGNGDPPLHAVRRLAAAYGVPVATVAHAAGLQAPRLLDRRQWRPGDLPAVLRTLRQWAGATQPQLAARCSCSVDAVRSWESGRATPSARMLARLERAHRLPDGALAAAL